MKDLLMLLPDKDIELLMAGLLGRNGFITSITYDPVIHEDRDHGCRKKFEDWVRGRNTAYRKLLVVFDRHGSGDNRDRQSIEGEMENRIRTLGWHEDDVRVVCIEPESEQWLWVNENQIKEALGRQEAEIYPFLQRNGWKAVEQEKPFPPKEAWRTLLKACQTKPSPNHFKHIGANGSIQRCTDPAFVKLRSCLSNWFGNQLDKPNYK